MLDISRKDILHENIMDFDPSSRFIKLPIDQYLGLLGTIPNSAQVALINAINKANTGIKYGDITHNCFYMPMTS